MWEVWKEIFEVIDKKSASVTIIFLTLIMSVIMYATFKTDKTLPPNYSRKENNLTQ